MATTVDTLAAAFKSGFAGDVTVPGDPGYHAARAVWNGTVDARPALIAHCRDAADVVAAVNVSREGGAVVAGRGGGPSVSRVSPGGPRGGVDFRRMGGGGIHPGKRG